MQKESLGSLGFKSASGNSYVYDDNLGLSFPAVLLSPEYLKKLEKIRKNSEQEIRAPKPMDVREYDLKNGLLQLTLCLTEDCNFRCKYCIYSENYEYTRGYSHRYMSFETAKKAIDIYFSLLEEGKRYNPWRDIAIGFYGGEPLLNFKVLKASVEYIKERYPEWKVSYTITTNATLMDREKADFLMDNDFSIAVSIDGPKEEHDRNRVYIDGRGTFDDVMKNVSYVMQRYEKIHSLAVFDWKSDLFRLDDFFQRKDVPQLSNISLVDTDMGCSYFKQFTKEDFENYRRQIDEGWRLYLEKVTNRGKETYPNINTSMNSISEWRASFFDQFFGLRCSKRIFQNVAVLQPHPIMPYTGSCIPGRKIYVDVDGNLHTCERINGAFPIGDVERGLNFEKISEMMSRYFESLDVCGECGVKRMCGHCYCNFATDSGFSDASLVCKNRESSVMSSLSDSFTLGEISPDVLESVAGDFYTLLRKLSYRED